MSDVSAAVTPASIVCSHLSFAWPDDTPVFDDLSFTVGRGRTGLVAPNGAGKSTLLALIAGVHRPTAGTVTVGGVLGYLPQTLPYRAESTVGDVLGVSEVLASIAAIEAGDVDERHFSVVGNAWDIEETSRALLDRLGLRGIELGRRLDTLSGGQIVQLGLVAELLAEPDVLLLDEPTNNLDADARQALYDVLDGWSGCLLVVSHDRTLLDRMDRIAELDSSRPGGEIRFFGGGFTAYAEAVEAERDAAEQRIRTAKQQVKREKREMQEARERAARRSGTAARKVADAGLPKIVAGELKRKAQVSAAKADDVHSERLSQARQRLDEAERSLRDDDAIVVDLPQTRVPAGRTVFQGEGIRVRDLFEGRIDTVDAEGEVVETAVEGIDLAIRGPERIALTGPNGAGKSTLLKVIAGTVEPDAGSVRRAEGRVAYLSQRLDVLDADRSVAENLAAFAPSMTPVDRMNLLARFLFRGDGAHRRVGALSGGELLRATLVCTLFAEPAPQLLLLDEPTNNLDLVSVGQLESALRAYEGAMVVVSHDAEFLSALNPTRHLSLRHGLLTTQ
ncbi:ABC-F family ATP-binding cassette domain-containing protein [Prauserella rugosa]|uniref:ATPase subunit of ABC transporter with duplicated ATPase domains n=1 Tax=Prauserella rugosa TaxID=43354 RepID=A0A660CDM6_9PSEU|nr:ABC-F family ATP-binding cassette domain-containing protein [Prauserella rugosa]TWH21502.1 ATPase subunit of ABC transporter with duplicated ATPase domains [Prauserella rugosa]